MWFNSFLTKTHLQPFLRLFAGVELLISRTALLRANLSLKVELKCNAEGRLLAGLSQRGVQVGRRKPATQADWGRSRLMK